MMKNIARYTDSDLTRSPRVNKKINDSNMPQTTNIRMMPKWLMVKLICFSADDGMGSPCLGLRLFLACVKLMT